MKKLLYFFILPLAFFLLSCGGGEGDLQPIDPTNLSMEETLVGQIWQIKDGQRRFLLNSNDGKLYHKYSLCDTFEVLGDWFFDGDYLRYTYTDGSLQITELFGEVDTFSINEIQFFYYDDLTTQISIIYQPVDPVIRGCLDIEANNYNPLSECSYCLYNMTYIPDNKFENALIDLGYDDVLDDSVRTSIINSITNLSLSSKYINDLTGIEDFISLDTLQISRNYITSLDLNPAVNLHWLMAGHIRVTELDLSQHTSLKYLGFGGRGFGIDCDITSLDLSNNTELIDLEMSYTKITSLDLTNNNNLIEISCSDNDQLTSLDLRNGNNYILNSLFLRDNINLNCINVDDSLYSTNYWTNIDPQHYFSEDCP